MCGTAIVTANGRQWQQPVDLISGEPTSLLLTDGSDGPALRPLFDVPDGPIALDPPALTMPAVAAGPPAPAEKMHARARADQSALPAVAGVCAAAAVAALTLIWSVSALVRREQVSR